MGSNRAIESQKVKDFFSYLKNEIEKIDIIKKVFPDEDDVRNSIQNGLSNLKKDINDFFGKSATSAFIESLIYAQKNNLGLLEANAILKLELAVGDETEIEIVNTIQEAENDVENKVLFQNEGEEKKSVFSRIFRKK
mgnify:CR=1 FL=1